MGEKVTLRKAEIPAIAAIISNAGLSFEALWKQGPSMPRFFQSRKAVKSRVNIVTSEGEGEPERQHSLWSQSLQGYPPKMCVLKTKYTLYIVQTMLCQRCHAFFQCLAIFPTSRIERFV